MNTQLHIGLMLFSTITTTCISTQKTADSSLCNKKHESSYQHYIEQGDIFLKKTCDKLGIHTASSHTSIYANDLHIAIGLNKTDEIEKLITGKKFDINASRVGGSLATPLHTAVQHYALSKNDVIQQKRYLNTIQVLLKLGAQPEQKNFWGEDIQSYAHRKNISGDLNRDIKL